MAASAAAAPAASPGLGSPWAVWLHINPRTGNPETYDKKVGSRLEAAWSAGESSIDLGAECFNAVVQFRQRMDRRMVQRTDKGSRDVLREELRGPTGMVTVQVVQGKDWRAGDGAGAQSRHLPIPAGVSVPASASPSPASAPGAAPTPSPGASPQPTPRPQPEGRWAAWFSVDPRRGDLVPYPPAAVQILEAALNAGKEAVDLGKACHDARVLLQRKMVQVLLPGSSCSFIQVIGKGVRDVVRVELDAPTGPALVWIYKSEKNNTWHQGKGDEAGATQASLVLDPGTAVKLQV